MSRLDIVRSNLNLENDLDTMQTGSKPSSFITSANNNGISRKKGLSLMSANTPCHRRKLGNLSNTPLGSHQKPSSLINNDDLKCSSLKKPLQPLSTIKNLSTNKARVDLPIVYEDIENAYPLNPQEFRQHHFPSEISDYFVEQCHSKILTAPVGDIEDERKLSEMKRLQELSNDDYFEGLL